MRLGCVLGGGQESKLNMGRRKDTHHPHPHPPPLPPPQRRKARAPPPGRGQGKEKKSTGGVARWRREREHACTWERGTRRPPQISSPRRGRTRVTASHTFLLHTDGPPLPHHFCLPACFSPFLLVRVAWVVLRSCPWGKGACLSFPYLSPPPRPFGPCDRCSIVPLCGSRAPLFRVSGDDRELYVGKEAGLGLVGVLG